MPRKRDPEATRARIVETALGLFMQNGYENTTLQDILATLGDLTKGAIYHHFKSKEDILIAATDLLTIQQEHQMAGILNEKDLTGLAKLQKLIRLCMMDPAQEMLFTTAPNLLDNPKVLALTLRESIELSAPEYVVPMVREGIADGSITTEYPEELAEVILILANVWVNPLVFPVNSEKLYRKIKFLDEMASKLGMPDLVGQEMFDRMAHYLTLLDAKKAEPSAASQAKN